MRKNKQRRIKKIVPSNEGGRSQLHKVGRNEGGGTAEGGLVGGHLSSPSSWSIDMQFKEERDE